MKQLIVDRIGRINIPVNQISRIIIIEQEGRLSAIILLKNFKNLVLNDHRNYTLEVIKKTVCNITMLDSENLERNSKPIAKAINVSARIRIKVAKNPQCNSSSISFLNSNQKQRKKAEEEGTFSMLSVFDNGNSLLDDSLWSYPDINGERTVCLTDDENTVALSEKDGTIVIGSRIF